MKKIYFILFVTIICSSSFGQFTIYNTSNSGLTDDFCWFVNKDNATSKIWVGTQSAGANVLSGSTWTNYTTSNSSITANYITPIAFDLTGNTWLGTYFSSGGVNKFDGTNWTSYTPGNSGIAGYDIVAIVVDASNNKWIGTRFNGLCKFDGTNWTTYNTFNSPLPSDVIYSLETDPLGNIWVGTALGGLAKLNGSTWTLYNTGNSAIPNDDIYSLKYNTSSNSLWVGTAGGIGVLSGSTWTVYSTFNSGLASNYVRGISFVPSSSEAWIATGYGGISKFDGINWQTYDTGNSNLPVNGIWSIIVTNYLSPTSYEIWASTWGGGIVKLSTCPQDIQLSSSVICSGNSASISASGSGSSAAMWYATPSSTPAIGSGNIFSTPTLTASNVPSFYSYYASNTCTSSPRSAITITVNPAPNLVLTSSNTKSVICRGQSVTLNASGANTYSWSQNFSVFSNNAVTSVTPASSTIYVLSGTNLNNCTSSASISLLVADCLGINQISNANDFVMFPNPTTYKLNVTFTSVQKNIVLTLFNIDGKQTSNGVYTNTENFSMDVSNLAKGIYFYSIQSDKETKTGKLVVDR